MRNKSKNVVRNVAKIIGIAMAFSMTAQTAVYAASDSEAELDEVFQTKDFTTMSETIDAIDEKVDDLNSDSKDEEKTDDNESGKENNQEKKIDELDLQIEILAKNYADLIATIYKYKADIIKGLNSSVYANDNISSDASYTDIISGINNIPVPKTAYGKYFAKGDNSGLGVELSDSATRADVNIDGVNELNLGVNQSITLPSGYYDRDLVINNNILNRGSLSLSPKEDKTYTIPSGFYEGGTIDTSNVYNAGKEEGYSAGKEEGYTAGKDAGYTAGKEAGYSAGKDAGYKEGKAAASVPIPRYFTNYTATYTIPKTGYYSLYCCCSGTAGDTHKLTVRATMTSNGRNLLTAESSGTMGKNDGLFTSNDDDVRLTKGQVINMNATAEGFNAHRTGQMFVVAYLRD